MSLLQERKLAQYNELQPPNNDFSSRSDYQLQLKKSKNDLDQSYAKQWDDWWRENQRRVRTASSEYHDAWNSFMTMKEEAKDRIVNSIQLRFMRRVQKEQAEWKQLMFEKNNIIGSLENLQTKISTCDYIIDLLNYYIRLSQSINRNVMSTLESYPMVMLMLNREIILPSCEISVFTPFPSKRSMTETGWELHSLYSILMQEFFKKNYIGFMQFFKKLGNIRCESDDFEGFHKLFQEAAFMLEEGLQAQFSRYFSLQMVLILAHYIAAPESILEKPYYKEQRDLLEEAINDIKDGKDEDPLLFEKLLKILTVESTHRNRGSLKKQKISQRTADPKPTTRQVAHSAKRETTEDDEIDPVFVRQMEMYEAMSTKKVDESKPKSNSNPKSTSFSGGSSARSKNSKTTYSSGRSDEKTSSRGDRIPPDAAFTPVDSDPDFLSNLTRHQPRPSGVVKPEDGIWVKIWKHPQGKPARCITVSYTATTEVCKSCRHAPKCWFSVSPCSKCGLYGHTRCLQKPN